MNQARIGVLDVDLNCIALVYYSEEVKVVGRLQSLPSGVKTRSNCVDEAKSGESSACQYFVNQRCEVSLHWTAFSVS